MFVYILSDMQIPYNYKIIPFYSFYIEKQEYAFDFAFVYRISRFFRFDRIAKFFADESVFSQPFPALKCTIFHKIYGVLGRRKISMYENIVKTYVSVEVFFDEAGGITPRSIQWEDGRVFFIDKILDVRPAASLKAGGQGMRYTCRIQGKETYLFYENPRWFVER